jgi:hypothetical protein
MADDAKKKALETASIVEDALRSIADNIVSTFEATMSGMDRTAQATAKDIQARFNKMAKVSDDIASNAVKLQQGLLSVKDINKQILERQVKQESLGIQLVTLAKQNGVAVGNINELIDGSIVLTDEQKESVGELVEEYKNAIGYNKAYIDQLKEQQTEQEKINKKLGISGSLIKGISKIPILGDLVKTDDALAAMNKKIAEGGGRWAAMGAGLKSIGGDIVKGLTDPLFLITQIFEILKGTDKATGDLAKNFNLSYSAANNLRSELTDIANSSNDAAVNTRGLQESMVAVGQALGSNARLNKEDLVTFTKLREQAGYTNEELVAMQKLTLATGGSLEKNSKTFLGTVARLNAQNKLAINAKQLFKDIANVSDSIKLSVGGTTEKIAEAAFKARQFGINLQQADSIASSLLDFESSISNELSAELITGKDLNMEKARLLALNGDIASASAEILKQVKGSAEFTAMNRIQQEALAKSVGMTRDDLAKSLIDREAAAKLGAKEGQSSQDAYNAAVKKYGIEKANQMLGNDALETQFQQQSVQERLLQTVEKLKEVFISIAEPILQIVSPFVDILLPVLSTISGVFGQIGVGLSQMSTLIKDIIIGWTIYKGITLTIAGIKAAMVGYEIAQRGAALGYNGVLLARQAILSGELAKSIGIATAWTVANFPLSLLALGTAASVGALIYSQMKDGVIDPSKGPVVSGGFGSVQLSDKDTAVFNGKQIVAGTNLGGKGNTSASTPQQDNSALIAEMRAMRQEQAKANSKPTIVENSMNGTKFGTSVAMNTYKIQ